MDWLVELLTELKMGHECSGCMFKTMMADYVGHEVEAFQSPHLFWCSRQSSRCVENLLVISLSVIGSKWWQHIWNITPTRLQLAGMMKWMMPSQEHTSRDAGQGAVWWSCEKRLVCKQIQIHSYRGHNGSWQISYWICVLVVPSK